MRIYRFPIVLLLCCGCLSAVGLQALIPSSSRKKKPPQVRVTNGNGRQVPTQTQAATSRSISAIRRPPSETPLEAAESSDFLEAVPAGLGGVSCIDCHRTRGLSQPDTDMGQAIQWPLHNNTLNTHSDLTFHRGRYLYTVKTQSGHSLYSVSDGAQTISIPILWSVGTPAQTWILQYHGRMYESLVSYYPSNRELNFVAGLDVTVGDEQLSPRTLQEAIGRPLSAQGVKTCFRCHSSNAVVDHKLNLAGLTPGVDCAHCHTDSDAHLASMLNESTTAIYPPNLKNLSTQQISDFCGQCHRSFDEVVRNGWRGPSNVRMQPYRLALSQCYNGTDPRISCIACHDPHQEVVSNTRFYDSKCLACHSPKASTKPPYARVCPVAKSNCVTCHMPRVKYPGGHFIFTDHYIRIVKKGEPYPY